MIDTIATVERNTSPAPGYKRLTLRFDAEIEANAGQFAMLKAHNLFEPLLRRALAVYRVEGADRLSFLYQVLGRGTQALSSLEAGAKVDILLPLGNAWLGRRDPSRAIVVAGGIGSASVLMLCEELRQRRIETQIFFGAASESVATGCGLADFRALELPLTLATDDGSAGEKGFVTAPLERHLREGGGKEATIYTCGPWAMMRRGGGDRRAVRRPLPGFARSADGLRLRRLRRLRRRHARRRPRGLRRLSPRLHRRFHLPRRDRPLGRGGPNALTKTH